MLRPHALPTGFSPRRGFRPSSTETCRKIARNIRKFAPSPTPPLVGASSAEKNMDARVGPKTAIQDICTVIAKWGRLCPLGDHPSSFFDPPAVDTPIACAVFAGGHSAETLELVCTRRRAIEKAAERTRRRQEVDHDGRRLRRRAAPWLRERPRVLTRYHKLTWPAAIPPYTYYLRRVRPPVYPNSYSPRPHFLRTSLPLYVGRSNIQRPLHN